MTNTKHIPSKRLKTWHRNGTAPGSTVLVEPLNRPRQSLKSFARAIAANGTDEQKATAVRWLASKGRNP